ncbi:hypothetical protein GEMRC1_007267 [Eukaryota sp. GEM-RC1]
MVIQLFTVRLILEWNNGVLVVSTTLPSGFSDATDVDFDFWTQIIKNFQITEAKHCIPEHRKHMVHIVLAGTLDPSALNDLLDNVQYALRGRPFNQGGQPLFDLIVDPTRVQYDPSRYQSVAVHFNGGYLDPQFFQSINQTLIPSGGRFLITGGSNIYSWLKYMQKYLLRAETYSWRHATSPLSVTTPHYMTRNVPRQHECTPRSSALSYLVKVVDNQSSVLMLSQDGIPFLVEKKWGRGSLIYCTAPFTNWNDHDLLLQRVLVYNFYNF